MAAALVITGCVPSAPGISVAGVSLDPAGAVQQSVTESAAAANAPKEPVTYQNKTYGFSFTLPAGWTKQSGEADSDSFTFMRVPIADSCSFIFHVEPMRKSFPAAAAVNAGVKTGKEDIEIGKLVAVKRRDDKRQDKSSVIGWEIEEKGKKESHKRIIWQAYDSQNRYYNFMTAAYTEKFAACQPDLTNIINSIKFE